MIRLRHKLFISILRGFDQAMLVGALLGITAIRYSAPGASPLDTLLSSSYQTADAVGVAVLALGWLWLFNSLVSYETNRFTTLRAELKDVLNATTAAAFLLLVVAAVFAFDRVTTEVVVWFWVTTSIVAICTRLFTRWVLKAARRSGYNYRHLLIIGCNPQGFEMARRIDAEPELGYKIVGFVAEQDALPAGQRPVAGRLPDIKNILEQGSVDEMLICLPFRENVTAILDIVTLARDLGIVVRLFPDGASAGVLSHAHLEQFEGDWVVTFFREQMVFQLLLKRVLDFAVSLVLLLLLSPLFLLTALAIKCTSPGPVFFSQERVGMNKRTFRLYKFRSMYIDAERRRRELEHLNEMDGPVFKIKNDPRITPLGRFIRKTSIDELPQLLNVLRGQMSLVGPRPPLPAEVDRYDWLYRKRLSIKPGITCLWQISGRNHISFKQWMAMDREYIENWSIWLDIQILAKTVPVVLLGKGAS